MISKRPGRSFFGTFGDVVNGSNPSRGFGIAEIGVEVNFFAAGVDDFEGEVGRRGMESSVVESSPVATIVRGGMGVIVAGLIDEAGFGASESDFKAELSRGCNGDSFGTSGDVLELVPIGFATLPTA
jgi:hypothetical protein